MAAIVVDKLWGREIWHHNDSLYCMKTLMLTVPFTMSSLHYHTEKFETFLVVHGAVVLEVGRLVHFLTPGSPAVDILPGVPHRFARFPGTNDAVIVEASTEHSDDDVTRIETARMGDLYADIKVRSDLTF